MIEMKWTGDFTNSSCFIQWGVALEKNKKLDVLQRLIVCNPVFGFVSCCI